MASINDWAAKAAARIADEYGIRKSHSLTREAQESHIAAIIATFAEPLVKLLKDRGTKAHDVICAHYYDDFEDCTCGATEWNKKVEEALDGQA